MITRDWFKSSASTAANNCVEVRVHSDGAVDVRDSKKGRVGPVIQFTPQEWVAFLEGAKGGEFDVLS